MEKGKEHELSQTHNEAVLKYESLSRPSVGSSSKLCSEERPKSKKTYVNEATLFQGLAVRGHSGEGNYNNL